jgi:hypothetical protein
MCLALSLIATGQQIRRPGLGHRVSAGGIEVRLRLSQSIDLDPDDSGDGKAPAAGETYTYSRPGDSSIPPACGRCAFSLERDLYSAGAIASLLRFIE